MNSAVKCAIIRAPICLFGPWAAALPDGGFRTNHCTECEPPARQARDGYRAALTCPARTRSHRATQLLPWATAYTRNQLAQQEHHKQSRTNSDGSHTARPGSLSVARSWPLKVSGLLGADSRKG